MAIINTFAKCLESPYLVADPTAPDRIGSLLSLAGDRLEAAANLRDGGDQADVVSFSYEAMFACVRALVYARGYREMGLRCLLLACDEFYVRPGLLDPAHIHAMERAQAFKADPGECLAAASAFVKRTLELLSQVPAKA